MTTKHQQPKKAGNIKEMSGIESNLMPFVSTIGFGGEALIRRLLWRRSGVNSIYFRQ